MQRISTNDFIIQNQPWLFVRSLRAVLREDPAVVLCTAHSSSGEYDYRLHIEADDPLLCLQNALAIIKHAIAGLLSENTRTAPPSA